MSAKGEPVRLLVFACQVCLGRTPTGHGDVVFAPGQLVAACNRCGTAHQLTAAPVPAPVPVRAVKGAGAPAPRMR